MIASAKEIAALKITLFNSHINFANIHFCNYCTKIFVIVVNTCVYRRSVDNKVLILSILSYLSLKNSYRKVPIVTTLVTFGFSSLFLSLLSGTLNLYRTWAVRSYDNNFATIVKTSTLFIWRNVFHVTAF